MLWPYVLKNLGVGVDFWPSSEGDFLTGPYILSPCFCVSPFEKYINIEISSICGGSQEFHEVHSMHNFLSKLAF